MEQKELENHPERFCVYPDQPCRKFLPIPELMHQMIFKALEEHVGMLRLKEIFGSKEKDSQVNWNTGNMIKRDND